jgi:outer membrane receptor protein involved in Fe transport
MERYFTLDAMMAVPVHKNLRVFAAAENLFNDRYTVGRTPVRTLGSPLLVRFGLRFAR